MNHLYVGTPHIELPRGSFFYIGDELPTNRPKGKVFDPLKHSFDPLRDIDKKEARNLARALYSGSPEGANTLTVRNGRRALAKALSTGKRLDQLEVRSNIKGVKEEVEGMIDELLFTDIARRVLCSEIDFAFTGKNTKVFARLNRVELGDDDALSIGLFLISRCKGQVILDDGGFYLRPHHISLIRENNLIVRVNTLSEAGPLKAALLRMNTRTASGAIYDDAVELAKAARLTPGTVEFNDSLSDAMS